MCYWHFTKVHIMDFVTELMLNLIATESKYDGLPTPDSEHKRNKKWRVLDCFPIHHGPSGKHCIGSYTTKCHKGDTSSSLRPLLLVWHMASCAESKPCAQIKEHTSIIASSVLPVVSPRSTTGLSPHCHTFIFLLQLCLNPKLEFPCRKPMRRRRFPKYLDGW